MKSHPPVLLLCADASPSVGLGHLSRCRVVAREWEARGGAAVVVTTRHAPATADAVLECSLPESEALAGAKIAERASELAASAVLIDGYRFRETFWTELLARRKSDTPIASFDDFGVDQGQAAADIIFKPTLGPLEYSHSRACLGLEFAPIAPEFRDALGSPPAQVAGLLALGGADPGDFSSALAPIVAGLLPVGGTLTVIRGPADPAPPVTADNITTVRAPRSVARVFAAHGFAVLAAGNMLLEAMACGLPVASFSRNEMQRDLLNHLHAARAVLYLGRLGRTIPPDVLASLSKFIGDEATRTAMASRARRMVDGLGAERVVAELRRTPDG